MTCRKVHRGLEVFFREKRAKFLGRRRNDFPNFPFSSLHSSLLSSHLQPEGERRDEKDHPKSGHLLKIGYMTSNEGLYLPFVLSLRMELKFISVFVSICGSSDTKTLCKTREKGAKSL